MPDREERGSHWFRPIGPPFFVPLLLVPMLYFRWPFEGLLSYVLGGELFRTQWNDSHAGRALDQPTIGKGLFWFTVFLVTALPYMALVRRISDRSTAFRRRIFTLCAVGACLPILCMLAVPSFWLLQYIHAHGPAPGRIEGLVYSVAGFGALVWFVYWIAKPPSPPFRKGQRK